MKHIIMGTAGHIDHGKTSLIKALTQIDCDTHKEEKARGITINLGFAYLNFTDEESVGIIDVPGHKDFINTMVGGACGIDMVLLVIAADSGIMPQTIEHVNIISALGISKGIVALTKIDAVDTDLAELAVLEVSEYLDKTILKGSPVIGVSSVTGAGIEDLKLAIQACVSGITPKKSNSLFRMYIDRIFTVKGFGNVVTGSVMGGEICVGQEVYLLPGNFQKLRIRSIERHGKSVEKVIAGDRAAINLIGLKNEDFERGMLLCSKKTEATTMIDAQIRLFDNGFTLPLWSRITFISGTFECQARMHILNKDSIPSNGEGIVQIHLDKPALLMSMDKFIIRNSSADLTLGGGYVIDASPLHHKRRTSKLNEFITDLSQNISSEQGISELIRMELKKEPKPFSLAEVAELLNFPKTELQDELEKQWPHIVYYKNEEGEILIEKSYNQLFEERLLKILKEHHAKNRLFDAGLDINELSGKLNLTKVKQGKLYLEILLQELKGKDKLDTYKNTWIIKGHKAVLDKQTQEDKLFVEKLISDYADEKPAMADIEAKAAENRINASKLRTYMSLLAQEGKIRYYQNDFMHTDIINKYRQILLKNLAAKENGIEYPEFKELMGGTKKFRALLSDFYTEEKIIVIKIINEAETRYCITEAGRMKLNELSD